MPTLLLLPPTPPLPLPSLLLLLPCSFSASNYYGPYLMHMVDYSVVDKLIEEDFGHGDGTYTLYLINPPTHVPYAYVYPHGM